MNPSTSPSQQDRHVTLNADTGLKGVAPGGEGILAIEFRIQPEWHIYWPGLSDSGYGTKLGIKASVGLTLGEPVWPTPRRYLQPGNILDNVYEDSATVLVPFSVNHDAGIGDVLMFEISTDYLVCNQICLPETAGAIATVDVVDPSSSPAPTPMSETIDSIRRRHPKPFDPDSGDARVQWIPDAAALIFRDAKKIEFFPSNACSELADPIAGTLADGDRLVVNFKSREDKLLQGRIRVHRKDARGEPTTTDYDISITPDP